MRITTKTGDTGQTALFGGSRVDKDHIRIECNGLIDEANTRIGFILVELSPEHRWYNGLIKIQRDIMMIMSHVATPPNCAKPNKKPHPEAGLKNCEDWINQLNEMMGDEKLAFVLPGGNRLSALCHSARTGFRTAERKLVSLNKQEELPRYILKYINRLSDLFYMLSMEELKHSKVDAQKFMLFPSEKKK